MRDKITTTMTNSNKNVQVVASCQI